MGRSLSGFQYQVVRRLTGGLSWNSMDGRWDYTSAEVARVEAGFEKMETYIWRSHNTVAQYIVTRSIMDLYRAAERKQGAWVGMRWREQARIDLAGARERATAAAAAEADKDGLEE